jgi:hypothetical protein
VRLAAALATLALLLLGQRNSARADTFALLAPGGPADLSATTRASAIDTVATALRAGGHRPTLPADVASQLAAARAPNCAALDCASAVLAALRVDAVLEVVLWSNGSGGVREVVVSIAWANGGETSGTSGAAPLGAGELPTGARAALTQALTASHAVPTARVAVSVSPRGAALTLDGRPLGQAPWEGLLPAGRHVLVAGHIGYLVERRELVLDSAPVELSLELTRDPAAEVTPAATTSHDESSNGTREAPSRAAARPRGRALLGPIVLGAVGLGLVSVNLGALVIAGGEPRYGFERSLDPLPFALYGAAGVGALVGALLWWLLSGEPSMAAASAVPPTHVALDLDRATFSLTF